MTTRSSRGAAAQAISLLVALTVLGAACSSDDDGGDQGADAADTTTAPAPGGPEHDGPRTRVTSPGGGLVLETSSTRADMVSAGDVLLTVSGDALGETLKVTVDGDDVTDAFSSDGAVMRGLVDGLSDGDHAVEATSGGETVSLEVVSHPKNGPVFSGPHLEPWVCKTEEFGIGPALDEDCDAETKTTWSYVAADGTVKPLVDPSVLPADVSTATVEGREVPFVVRLERGVIDRGGYWIWVLDPAPRADGAWDPAAWNRRLVYQFGGGCGTQYSQGSTFSSGITPDLLGKGYAIATNSLDTLQTSCNTVLSAEAALMTREHFAEHYGVPDFTIGDGGSGGAIQQLAIGHNYPGLLDALSPSVPFPDVLSTAAGVTDCGLLLHYYASEPGTRLTDDQREAISGHASTGTCEGWKRYFLSGVDPTQGCDASLAGQVYDPETNPDGVRCTVQDSNVNVLGSDPETGFAPRALDNVGVQYGLGALEEGAITVDEFLDLNEGIGGYDIDGKAVAERETIGEDAVRHTYEVGSLTGAGPLQDVPIILRNVYTDEIGDIHTRVWPFAIRERLRGEDGEDEPNLLLWTVGVEGTDLTSVLLGSLSSADAIVLLDEWLTTGERPAGAQNRCVLPDGELLEGGWELYDEAGPCRDAYPVHSDPRFVAGQGPRGDIVKCELVAVDASAYEADFSDEQADRLAEIFPDGVCDWSRPGIGQVPTATTWRSYGP